MLVKTGCLAGLRIRVELARTRIKPSRKTRFSGLGPDPAVNKNNSGSNPRKTTRNWIQPNSHLFFFPIQKAIWLMHYREIKAGLRIRVEWIWIRTSRKTGSGSNPRKTPGSDRIRIRNPDCTLCISYNWYWIWNFLENCQYIFHDQLISDGNLKIGACTSAEGSLLLIFWSI